LIQGQDLVGLTACDRYPGASLVADARLQGRVRNIHDLKGLTLGLTSMWPGAVQKDPLDDLRKTAPSLPPPGDPPMASSPQVEQQVRRLLASLDPETRTILELRYGLGEDGRRRTLTEISRLTGRSRDELRRIEAEVATRLRG